MKTARKGNKLFNFMFYSKLQNKMDRACGACTMCCNGVLYLQIGEDFFQGDGKSCKFLNEVGCKIYNNRPSCCQNFLCMYRTHSFVPEWMKPNLSRAMLVERTIKGVVCMEVLECGKTLSDQVIDWTCDLYNQKKISNILIEYKKKMYLITDNKENFDNITDLGTNEDVHSIKDLPFIVEKLEKVILS